MTLFSFVSVFHRFPEKFLPLLSEQGTVVTQDGRSSLLRNIATSLKNHDVTSHKIARITSL